MAMLHGDFMEAQTLTLLKDGSGDGQIRFQARCRARQVMCVRGVKCARGSIEVHEAGSARSTRHAWTAFSEEELPIHTRLSKHAWQHMESV